ncbi:MAG: type I restriction endonuclease subunit R [Gemmatimonadetes bacterium]|nr:type I restriction endonuclease subunit R [Gemmatimonadota bacterium]
MSGYSEDALVEQPAIKLLEELGWEIVKGRDLKRETQSDAMLTARLCPALKRLNPQVPPEAIDQASAEITRDRSQMSMVAANREVYLLLKNGVRTTVLAPEDDGETVEIVRVIDWDEPANNDFLLCSQFRITGEMHTRRADLVGFVNGLPLVLIELKAAHRRLETAYKDNLRDYKDTVPHLFWANALIILSNGSESRVGSITAEWEHFAEWKKGGSESEEGRVSLETMLRGVCAPARLLDLMENFTLFQDVAGGTIKLTAKNHQYLGVNNALAALRCGRQLGVFWHTQGSGKSVSMMFLAQKVLRKIPGNWTFVIVTDRRELDGQIYKHFVASGVVTEGRAHAGSSQHLRQLLGEDHRYVFTLIHKFRTEAGETHPVLSKRSDMIVITDEAHRSQYDTLALNMRTALPNAAFMAFTGTPLIVGEEKTRQVFGDYVSVYNFQQSVTDGATVPLYYENRIPELQLTNDDFNDDLERLLEESELDEAQEKKLEREFSRQYHLITRDDRLEAVARDVVAHFSGRGFCGKAMVICIDKATAVRMYDKVQNHWQKHLGALRAEPSTVENEKRIAWLEETDMAVVVSPGQNEIAEFAAKGLNMRPHRQRSRSEDLETKFKDPHDPFRLVFVCAMWMTGFDVPSCSTLYLDKPMRNHTLMQTIARANRVYPGKISGVIVDYVGVFRNLERALAIYGGEGTGDKPVREKSALMAALEQVLAETSDLCRQQGADLAAIQEAEGFARIRLLDDAVEALVAPEAIKRQFLDLANNVQRLYKAVLPDPTVGEFAAQVKPVQVIVDKMRALAPPADIAPVMQQVEDILDDSIVAAGYSIAKESKPYSTDLSQLDVEKLSETFESLRIQTINERFRWNVERKLLKLVQLNPTRTDFAKRFQALIDDYNAGSLNDEKLEFLRQLVIFAQGLSKEEQRGVSERLDEEELAIFDLLTKSHINLNDAEREKIKATARDLLATLKAEKLTLDWRKRQQARAEVHVTIRQFLDAGLPQSYTPELFTQKTTAVFEHVYDAYYGAGQSIYAA